MSDAWQGQAITVAGVKNTHVPLRITRHTCYECAGLSVLFSTQDGVSDCIAVSGLLSSYLQGEGKSVHEINEAQHSKWGCRSHGGVSGDLQGSGSSDQLVRMVSLRDVG